MLFKTDRENFGAMRREKTCSTLLFQTHKTTVNFIFGMGRYGPAVLAPAIVALYRFLIRKILKRVSVLGLGVRLGLG